MTPRWSPAGFPFTWWMGIATLGFVVGIVSGMFGVGGTFLIIPALNIWFKVPLTITVGTSLCQVVGSACASLVRHSRLKQGELKIDWLMLGGGLTGAQVGALALSALSKMGSLLIDGRRVAVVRFVISLTYAVILLGVALAMALDARYRPASRPLGAGPLTRIRIPPATKLPRAGRTVSVLLIAYLGLIMGFLSGLLGMGGGVLLLPILLYGIGMRMRMAAGTGILMLVVSAMAGTLAHAMLGHVHLGLAVVLLAGSTLGAPIGAGFTAHTDGRRLRAIFAGLVTVTALAVLWNLYRILRG